MNTLKDKIVLVTGGAGFIGSNLCEALIKLDAFVICMDNFSTGDCKNLYTIIDNKKFEILNRDITDFDCKLDVDYIFNLAASKKNICLKNPIRDLSVNGGGTLNLLLNIKTKKFIHSSTGSVYGENSETINENSQLNPVSYYGISKLSGENYVKLFNKKGLNTTILRYFHVYGKNQSDDSDLGGVISIFINKIKNNLPITIYGDGNQIRTFTHVDDIVKANLISAVSENSNGKIYNVASGIKVTINQLSKLLMDIIGNKVDIIYKQELEGDIRNFNVDNTKIRNDFGIDFKTNIKNELIKLIEGML